jgi:hypothetical protein
MQMPNINDMYPSKYLKASDIDQDYEVTIKAIGQEVLGQGADAEEKYIAYFNELNKGLALNKTNAGLIAAQHGIHTENWIGKTVILTVEDVAYQGKLTPSIRIRRPARPVRPVAPACKPVIHTAPKPAPVTEQEAANQAADESVPF